MDPRRALSVLRRWWPVLVVGTLLAAGAAYAVSKSLPRVYQATVLLDVNPGLGTVGGGQDFNEVQAAAWQAAKDAQLIHTTPIAQAAIHRAGLDGRLDPGTLLKNATAQAAPQMSTVSLAVRANSPADASNLANAMAAIFIARDAQSRTSGYSRALGAIESKMRYYSRDDAQARAQQTRLALRGGAQTSQGAALSERIVADEGMLSQLRQSADGIQLYLAGAGSSLTLAQPATADPAPISPRTAVNTLVAAVLALLILLATAFLFDFFDNRPRTAADVAAGLDLPLAGTIDAARGRSALVVLDEPASALADQYRALRAAVDAAAAGNAPTSLLVTGVRDGDGATTVAANVAAVAARAGARVALVDANLRRPSLHTLFTLDDRAGLTMALRDGADAGALLQDSALPGLRVLVAGPGATQAIDLLGSERMRAALAALGAAYDLVVVDTAPAGSPDAAVLAPLAAATLVVARLHGTTVAELADAGRQLRLAGARLAGVAVTLFDAPGAVPAPRPGATQPATRPRATQPASPQVEAAQPEAAPRPGLRSAK